MPFTDDYFDFLFENRARDSREWFGLNRARYNSSVLAPLRETALEMAPAILEIDPDVVLKPGSGGTVSRIFRDARFSKDKTIFRDNMWISFSRGKREGMPVPEFYFQALRDEYSFGLGFYTATPAVMESMRSLILSRSPVFMRLFEWRKGQDFFTLAGERYKRSKYPDEPPDIREWLDMKGIYMFHASRDTSELYKPGIGRRAAEAMKPLKALNEFLWEALRNAGTGTGK